jgi:diguanylate cyclase (GGDEF)-like protein
VLPPTTSTLPWRRNLEGILANSDLAEASAPEFTAARTALDDDTVTRLRAATVTDALAVVDRLGTLADGTTELHSARPRGLADVSSTAVTVLRRALDLDTVAVIQLDGDTATSLASWGDALPPAAVLTGLVAAAPAGGGQLVALSREGVGSVVASALTTSGPSTGVLWAARRAPKPDFDRWERNLVTEAAATLSLVLDDSSERRRLELLAHTDALTGLGNRGALDDELRRIFAAPIVERTDTALIMCDVDGLKNVNDTRGHAAGDDMLRTVADLLVELTATAPAASLYRLGGDEFCVLLREGGLLEADALASDLAHRGADLDIGLSCGVSYGVRAESARALLDAADEAQYAVKRRRRAMSSPGLEVRAGVGRRARRDRE